MATQAHPLTPHLISDLPPSFYYLPSFLTPLEESALLSTIASKPYIPLAHRRLQVYPAQLTAKNVLLSKDSLPSWLVDPLQHRFDALDIFNISTSDGETKKPQMNHVLINNYRPGEGILPHEDGAAYYPVTATVSLGSHTVLDVYEKLETGERAETPRWRILQEPRSLLVTKGEAYECTLHGIAEVSLDGGLDERGVCNWGLVVEKEEYRGERQRGERVSLTCRCVRKVSSLGRLVGR